MAMKGREYKKALKTLKLSQAKGALFLGFSTRQSRRIAANNGKAALRLADEKLLRVMLEFSITVEMVDGLMKAKRAKPAPKSAPAPVAP